VDLSGVTFIDTNGEEVLAELCKQGAELVATGIYTRHVVPQHREKKVESSAVRNCQFQLRERSNSMYAQDREKS